MVLLLDGVAYGFTRAIRFYAYARTATTCAEGAPLVASTTILSAVDVTGSSRVCTWRRHRLSVVRETVRQAPSASRVSTR